ncbi:MAG: tripartite tricarboxylate transporter permease [Deltaproteobacteria bacterium]|nr:tripartite tricarboxylate transporter permease [Deltaproteobacteria bacterium]
MELFLDGLKAVLSINILVALLVGAIGGVIIGAIPGVGAAIAIAIVLPATFHMEPLVGLTLLLGIYAASAYGGAIPAVLINTPGTPVNALTTYDGYPMTRRGEGRRALSLAYSSSFFGGIFSVVCLILITPFLAAIAPMFGSRDIFMAALLGIVLVIIAHRGRSLAAGMFVFFGMFLNTVGMENIRYTQRYTFGLKWLYGGFDLIPVVIGLFALSQAFVLLINENEQPEVPKLEGGLFQGLAEVVLRFKKIATPSAGFGVIMGIIPGVGEFLAQFFSYSLAQRISKTPERFGRGAPEGIVASETANNAVPAAAMIPLLSLGIPGEALTAMMLSVFYVHNIIPGPALFSTTPEFPVSLYLCLFVGNLIILLFLVLTTNKILYLIRVPSRFLGVLILALSLVGVYSVRNSLADCTVAAAFGTFGYVLKRLDLPIVPIILGMVLGRILDDKFRSGLARIETPLDLINRPVAAAIFGIIIIALIAHFWGLYTQRRSRTGSH